MRFFGSFTYTLARAKLGIEPLARPENKDGISTYYGLIFVRKDSGIKTAKDMEGKRLVAFKLFEYIALWYEPDQKCLSLIFCIFFVKCIFG